VRKKSADTWRRGVVFVRELVPRRAIALVARTFYGENMSLADETSDRSSRSKMSWNTLATRTQMGIAQDERKR